MPKLVRLVAIFAILTLIVRKKRAYHRQEGRFGGQIVPFPGRPGRNQPVYV